MAAAVTDHDPCIQYFGISWEQYDGIVENFGDHRFLHSYCNDTLEVIDRTNRREWLKKRVDRLLHSAALEFRISMMSLGSTTWRRESLQVGLEPDECYYFGNELRMRRVRDVDFENDPPPDLVLEIDIAKNWLSRQKIYATLGVPEIWRVEPDNIEFLLRQSDSTYRRIDRSFAIPQVRPEYIAQHIKEYGKTGETTWVNNWIAWFKELNQTQ